MPTVWEKLCSRATLAMGVLVAFAGSSPAGERHEVKRQPSAPALSNAPVADGVLVVHLLVPLCDNAQVNCGSKRAGEPDNLEHNLYWGAVFGHRKFITRKGSGFELVAASKGEGDLLERLVVRRRIESAPWGRKEPTELIVVLDAFRGDRIDAVVDSFYREAERGMELTFADGEHKRSLGVDVVGYAGHNRMMDGKQPPERAKKGEAAPIPSFVLACDSNGYFAKPLFERGSSPVLLTSTLMAPEGYVLEAALLGLSANETRPELRQRAGRAYAKWQTLTEQQGLSIFAKLF